MLSAFLTARGKHCVLYENSNERRWNIFLDACIGHDEKFQYFGTPGLASRTLTVGRLSS